MALGVWIFRSGLPYHAFLVDLIKPEWSGGLDAQKVCFGTNPGHVSSLQNCTAEVGHQLVASAVQSARDPQAVQLAGLPAII